MRFVCFVIFNSHHTILRQVVPHYLPNSEFLHLSVEINTFQDNAGSQSEKPDSKQDSWTREVCLSPLCCVASRACLQWWHRQGHWRSGKKLAQREVRRENEDLVMVRSILFYICLFCSEITLIPLNISLFCLSPFTDECTAFNGVPRLFPLKYSWAVSSFFHAHLLLH